MRSRFRLASRFSRKSTEIVRSDGSLNSRRWSRVSPTDRKMSSLPGARAASAAFMTPLSSRSPPANGSGGACAPGAAASACTSLSQSVRHTGEVITLAAACTSAESSPGAAAAAGACALLLLPNSTTSASGGAASPARSAAAASRCRLAPRCPRRRHCARRSA